MKLMPNSDHQYHKGVGSMRVLLYGNGSCGNHGCEAIVRGTIALLGTTNTFRVQSDNSQDDIKYGLNILAEISPAKSIPKKDLRFVSAYIKLKLTGDYSDMDGLHYISGIHDACSNADIAFSVGGDNYCYGGTEIYAYLNRAYRKRGVNTVLWGCSIEPDVVSRKSVSTDLSLYNLIVARESISYASIGRVQSKVILSPDPAFFMEPMVCNIDDRLHAGNVIGINVSPMIISNEKKAGMAYENYRQLVQYILSETDAYVALIPHVVWDSNDDRRVLRQLYDDFGQDPRLIPVEDHTAPELKYIISKCAFFVGARTHATIAAYSSCVPTLVVGYSVKARGIARDLFGTEDQFVLPVQSLNEPGQLSRAFQELYAKRAAIKEHLQMFLPDYCAKADAAIRAIKELVIR